MILAGEIFFKIARARARARARGKLPHRAKPRGPPQGAFNVLAEDVSRRFLFPCDSPGCPRAPNKWGPFCPKKYYGGEAEKFGTFPLVLAPDGGF